jgi:phenylpropionate dioxygenase-like ring-hydroxylating dioxygenase large terminal subunit
MTTTSQETAAFSGYYAHRTGKPDMYLCSVDRGTPGGEYLRRFWHPVAFVDELEDVPLRVRALGEDLVAFKDRSGKIGVVHLRCRHRNTSLEFGILTERGIRCCYHGREYAPDGRCIDIPGDPAADKLMARADQGGYPTHVWGGILFVYMGPPERIPVFPMYDRLTLPGVKIVQGERFEMACNWVQMKENTVDPHHTAVLHVIPQLRGMDHFADEFGNFPELSWTETPAGVIYLGVRVVDGNLWVRSGETVGATMHCISSIFETGRAPRYASAPFMTFWTLPVDVDRSITFYVSHVLDRETMPFAQRRYLEVFGQRSDRPYRERQWIPGDSDAQEGQGPINVHADERLGSFDKGVTMFRRQLRRGIDAVARGKDPLGFYLHQADVPATYANDFVVPIADTGIDPTDSDAVRSFADVVWQHYQEQPPMMVYAQEHAL